MPPSAPLPGSTARQGYETAPRPRASFLRLSSLRGEVLLDPDQLQSRDETEAPFQAASSLPTTGQSHPRALRLRDHLQTPLAPAQAYSPSCMTRPRVAEPIHISLLSTNHVYGRAESQDSSALAPTFLCRHTRRLVSYCRNLSTRHEHSHRPELAARQFRGQFLARQLQPHPQ